MTWLSKRGDASIKKKDIQIQYLYSKIKKTHNFHISDYLRHKRQNPVKNKVSGLKKKLLVGAGRICAVYCKKFADLCGLTLGVL